MPTIDAAQLGAILDLIGYLSLFIAVLSWTLYVWYSYRNR